MIVRVVFVVVATLSALNTLLKGCLVNVAIVVVVAIVVNRSISEMSV